MHYNFVIMGESGTGKSALANTLIGYNKFKESSSAVSETRRHQHETIKKGEDTATIVDTIGFLDTEVDENEVAIRIKDALNSCPDGFNQILFVSPGRFKKESWSFFQKVLGNLSTLTCLTWVRTNFSKFQIQSECEKDIELLKSSFPQVFPHFKKVIHMNNMNESEDPSSENRKIGHEILWKYLLTCTEKYIPNLESYTEKTLIEEATRIQKLSELFSSFAQLQQFITLVNNQIDSRTNDHGKGQKTKYWGFHSNISGVTELEVYNLKFLQNFASFIQTYPNLETSQLTFLKQHYKQLQSPVVKLRSLFRGSGFWRYNEFPYGSSDSNFLLTLKGNKNYSVYSGVGYFLPSTVNSQTRDSYFAMLNC